MNVVLVQHLKATEDALSWAWTARPIQFSRPTRTEPCTSDLLTSPCEFQLMVFPGIIITLLIQRWLGRGRGGNVVSIQSKFLHRTTTIERMYLSHPDESLAQVLTSNSYTSLFSPAGVFLTSCKSSRRERSCPALREGIFCKICVHVETSAS